MKKLLRKNGEGFVLVAVLWAAVLLTLICATADRGSRMDLKVCMNSVEEVRCRWASRAGMDTAMAFLIEEKISAQQSDTAADTAVPVSAAEMDLNDVPLEGCRFTVQFIDEAGKLNINTATKEQLMRLVDMTEDTVDAILDWRDSDDLPREGGVEGGYYENLPYWYTIRNGSFRTVRELLAVRDVVEDLFYGDSQQSGAAVNVVVVTNETQSLEEERAGGWMQYLTCYSYDGNVDAEGNTRININTANESTLTRSLGINQAQARWIVENRGQNQYGSIADLINSSSARTSRSGSSGRNNRNQQNQTEPIDLETFGKIADKITVRDDAKVTGRINVNTASRVVLEALLAEQAGPQQIALDIISHRQTLENGMESIAELLNVGSVTVDIFKAIADSVTVRSDVYMVRCYATAERADRDGLTLQTEAVLDRAENPCKVLYWYQGANN